MNELEQSIVEAIRRTRPKITSQNGDARSGGSYVQIAKNADTAKIKLPDGVATVSRVGSFN